MEETKVRIKGLGVYLPQKIVTNFDLEQIVDTSDQWIFERTGIKERRICSTEGGEWPSDMAYHASNAALAEANLSPNDIDLIIFSSVTPDYKLPNSSSVLQQKLGITNRCGCMDISVACSGHIYGMNLANALILTGQAQNVLLACSEMLSRETDWSDRSSCILFGDGCGVTIFGKSQGSENSTILSSHLGADGSGALFFDQLIGGSVTPINKSHLENNSHFMRMQGREMFKVATRTLAENAKIVLDKAKMGLDDIDWFIPHQANARIIETTGKLLGIDPRKVIVNIEKFANTSAASIPMAFRQAIDDGRIKRGDIILMDAFGAGLTSGATLIRY